MNTQINQKLTLNFSENPEHDDADRRREAADTGGSNGEPGHPPRLRGTIPSHPLIHI